MSSKLFTTWLTCHVLAHELLSLFRVVKEHGQKLFLYNASSVEIPVRGLVDLVQFGILEGCVSGQWRKAADEASYFSPVVGPQSRLSGLACGYRIGKPKDGDKSLDKIGTHDSDYQGERAKNEAAKGIACDNAADSQIV